METPWLYTALLTGLAGSLHCVGMCGPLAMALPVGRLPRRQRWAAIALYHAGRLTAYGGLGAAMGLLGQTLVLTGLQRPVSIGAGVLLLVVTLLRREKLYALRTTRLGRWLTKPMMQLMHTPRFPAFAGLGFLNGLLPCGFVYVAMAGSLGNESPVQGTLYMVIFGLGTLPTLLGVRLVPELLPLSWRRKLGRALPLVTVLVALLLIARGLRTYEGHEHTSRSLPSAPICHGSLSNPD